MSETIEAPTDVSSKEFQEQFQRLVKAWGEAGQYVQDMPLAQTPYTQAQTVRYMLRLIYGMTLTGLEFEDALYPKLVRVFDSTNLHPNTNPDCTYFVARVEPEHEYRITGFAGTSQVLEVQMMSGRFAAGPNHGTLGTLSDLKGDEHGNIEIILSTKPHPGNWLKLDPDCRWIYVRQYYYDWNRELPANIVIERIGATYPPPNITSKTLKERVDQLIDWMPTWHRHLMSRAVGFYEAEKGKLSFFKSPAGMDGLFYGKGAFDLAPDEVAILEYDPPKTPYWSFQIMNDLWETLQFDTNQCSLNGYQSELDPDGKFRGVISVEDPGVPNWLDPVGNHKGLICLRVLRPDRDPEVSVKVVKKADLAKHLHPETRKVSKEERSAAMRLRMFGTERRHRQ